MRYRVIICGLSLLALGIITTLYSLIQFPSTSTEKYLISQSKTYYDHDKFAVLSNSSEFRIIKSERYYEMLPIPTVLNISFQAQPCDIDLHIEYKDAFYVWCHVDYHVWVKMLKIAEPWIPKQSFFNVSSLDITLNSSVQEIWQLRFANNDLQTDKIVDLSVTLQWTEVTYRDVTTHSTLLPSQFAYIGFPALLAGAVFLSRRPASLKVIFTREHAGELVEDLQHCTGAKEIIITLLLTSMFLFSSFIAHVRFTYTPVTVSTYTLDIPITYYGFPFEIIGILNPLTRAQDAHVNAYTQIEGAGRLQVLGKGLVLDVLIYLILAFTIVYLFRKFRG